MLHPMRQTVMHEIDDRIDVKFEHALKRGVDEAEIPGLRRRLDAMPGHAIARAGNAQARHQRDILFPPPVMIRQLIFVEHAPGSRMRSGDERVFNAGRPQKGARRSEPIEFRRARKHQAQIVENAGRSGGVMACRPEGRRGGTTDSAGADPMAQERRSSKASSVSSPRVAREPSRMHAHARGCSGAPAPTLTLEIGVGSAAPAHHVPAAEKVGRRQTAALEL